MKKDKTNTDIQKNIEADNSEKDKKFFSDKKTVVRFILFIIALVTAVAFITYGVSHIGYKEEGIYEITCDNDEEVPHYFSGVTFMYVFHGESSAINASMKIIKGEYSESLKMNFKLFDPINTYSGLVNLAYINRHPGEEIAVGEELFEALSDAYEKTCEKKGYDMFSGLAARLRDQTVYSANAAEHDYYEDQSLRDIEQRLKELSLKEDGVVFRLDENKRTVFFDLSDEYKSFLKEYELDGAIIDLDLLHDAYMLKYVVRSLEKGGYTEGYITTKDGLTILLSGMSDGDFCLYSGKSDQNETVISATVPCKGGSSSCSFRVFALGDGESGYYTYEKDGKTLYRNKYVSDFEKDIAVLSALSVSDEFSAAEAVYSNVVLINSSDVISAKEAAGNSACKTVLFETEETEKNVYIKSDSEIKINAEKGYNAISVK